jgi:hypothetical protein
MSTELLESYSDTAEAKRLGNFGRNWDAYGIEAAIDPRDSSGELRADYRIQPSPVGVYEGAPARFVFGYLPLATDTDRFEADLDTAISFADAVAAQRAFEASLPDDLVDIDYA